MIVKDRIVRQSHTLRAIPGSIGGHLTNRGDLVNARLAFIARVDISSCVVGEAEQESARHPRHCLTNIVSQPDTIKLAILAPCIDATIGAPGDCLRMIQDVAQVC